MRLKEQIDWLNENRDWVESLHPLSINLCDLNSYIDIHANSKAKSTIDYFKENRRIASADYAGRGVFYCLVRNKGVQITSFLKRRDVEEINIEIMEDPFNKDGLLL